MPARQQVALEPTLTEMFAQDLNDPAFTREMHILRQDVSIHTRSVTSNTAPRRFDVVSSGPTMRKLRVGVQTSTSRSKAPITRVASACAFPGEGT